MPTAPMSHAQRERKRKKAQYNREYYERRKNTPELADAAKVRSSMRWQNVRALKLRQQPTCEDPDKLHLDRPILAKQVDHIIPLQAGGDAFAMDNLQSLCVHCHAVKSARERRENSG